MTALKILVVDDASFIRDLIKRAVKAQYPDAKVEEASDGLQAQKIMRSKHFHVLLCDWEMPNLSGLELLEWMREDDYYKTVPFMMITSRSEKSHIVKAVEAGVSDYIGKPFNNEQLGTKLARLIYKFYKTSPKKTARQAQQESTDSASLLTGGGGSTASSAQQADTSNQSASLLTGGAGQAKPSTPAAKKPARNVALAHVRLSTGEELRCIVKDINLSEMMLVVKREQGVPTLFDQVVVDIVSKEEDIVARVNCFVCGVQSPDKRINGELFNMQVKYEDEDPEKLASISKFVEKMR
ncbi:response regulator [Bermanella sp. R86510]|uniref:response regulator n=1 Tax=unclassified Bermanella TaxID=2627862 RepID=UPI0037CAE9B8